jgi:hypothetical protein
MCFLLILYNQKKIVNRYALKKRDFGNKKFSLWYYETEKISNPNVGYFPYL